MITKKERVAHKLKGERPFVVTYEARVWVARTVWAQSFQQAEGIAESVPGPGDTISAKEVAAAFKVQSEVILESIIDLERNTSETLGGDRFGAVDLDGLGR